MADVATEQAAFGTELRRHRIAAGLTQEELAERAGLSARGIQDLESGARRSPRPETVRRLAAALVAPTAAPDPDRRVQALPIALTSFVGRERDVVEVAALLRQSRLVTLTGAGGIGKSRLSLEVAAAVAPHYAGGVAFTELASLADSELVVPSVAAALGIREQPFRPLIDTVRDALTNHAVLLILDNCEHVLAACVALLENLLRSCPLLHVLATSREPLQVSGETILRVPSLRVPDPEAGLTLDALAAHGATQLFLERAEAVRRDRPRGERGMRALVTICQRLDGVPLAIELAAARTSMFTVEQIAQRLDEALRLLSSGSRSAPPRHQTLRAAVDWSVALLAEPEQRLLENLSVFAGGWTFDAAEAVAGMGDVLDLLGRLVDKSLVVAEPSANGEIRYRLLEVLRQYSAERLAERADAHSLHARHAAYFEDLVQVAEDQARTTDRKACLDRLELELDNLRAARRWFIARGDVEAAQRLCWRLCKLLVYRGHANEGRAGLLEALALPGGSDTTRAQALHFVGSLAYMQADYPAAIQYGEQSLVLRRQIGDPTGLAWALGALGITTATRGDFDTANSLLDQARQASRRGRSADILALNLSISGLIEYLQGNFATAREYAQESLDVATANALASIESMALSTLGRLSYQAGHRDAASAALRASLARAETLGDPYLRVRAALSLVLLEMDGGDTERTRALVAESLTLARQLTNPHYVAQALEGVAVFAAQQGHAADARRFAATASAIRASIGAPISPTEQRLLDNRLGPLREWVLDAGQSASVDEATALALEFLNASFS